MDLKNHKNLFHPCGNVSVTRHVLISTAAILLAAVFFAPAAKNIDRLDISLIFHFLNLKEAI